MTYPATLSPYPSDDKTHTIDDLKLRTDHLKGFLDWNTVNQADVVLTTAQVKALFTTPITLLAAPGAGLMHLVEDVTVYMPYATTAYTVGTATNLEVRYTNGAGQLVSSLALTGFADQTASQIRFMPSATASAVTPVANAPVVIDTAVANMTLGDSPLHVRIRYRTVASTF